ncbi:MAG: SDR family NAD(P)-dependent oxidoreductase [Fibrobacter sp.]|nr:SDR family NAD(P)-dependent oxidoreductase [Fibrobacter sp.]
MSKLVLITGGAGFIGSHVSDALLKRGYRVRVIDNLSPQVHGKCQDKPEYLDPEVEFIKGDITDSDLICKCLKDVDIVFHFAASVGVGQSMYQIQKYTHTNNFGTAVLLQNLINNKAERLIVASSMSVYGEGLYKTINGELIQNAERSLGDLQCGKWDLCDLHGNILEPVPTSEVKIPALASLYALSKYDQERMCLVIGRAYNIPTVAMRFFNVYGTRQALSNPYTGVLAIFAARLLNNKPPLIFEDGLQKRDFVSVHDVCNACILALEKESVVNNVFNIGSGKSYTVTDVSRALSKVLGREHIEPHITCKYRVGDIRHCFADITRAENILGYKPQYTLEQGLGELAFWLEGQIASDNFDVANSELIERGLAL